MKRRRRGSVAPIYIFILVWLLCSMAAPMYKLWALLLTLGLSVAAAALVGSAVKAALKKREPKDEPAAAPEPRQAEKPAKSYGPEVDAIIAEGRVAMGEMGRLYTSIKSPEIRAKINELMRISDKIIQDAIEDPSDVPQIKKFLNYYLPTTIKLLNAYDRMSDQGIEGENLTRSMSSIEDMLDSSIEAFKKQLDSLFANQAMDIETDITVMNQMLAREGLSGGGELDDIILDAARGKSSAAAQQKAE